MALGLTNIDTRLVGNYIGCDSDFYATLCTFSTINPWSRYRPGYLKEDGTGDAYLIWQAPRGNAIVDPRDQDPDWSNNGEGYKIGDFRGYNHDAIAPYIDDVGSPLFGSASAGTTSSVGVTFYFGEVNWKMLEERLHRSLNFLIEPLYFIVTDEANVIKGAVLIPTDLNGNITVPYSFTVPNAGNTANFTARIGFGITDSNVSYRLGNNHGAIGIRTFTVETLAAMDIYAMGWDGNNISDPEYGSPATGISFEDQHSYFQGNDTAVWEVGLEGFAVAHEDLNTINYKRIKADWYITGFQGDSVTEYLVELEKSVYDNYGNNTVVLPVSGSPTTFTDGDTIQLVLKNIVILF